ncbi:uncharacterized protein [Drosophila tropicalis]|uniref:uncharacterized protein n=1 Tax=Drosophila tropicalis TaxID=46794 RepID=UPI0035ABBB5C
MVLVLLHRTASRDWQVKVELMVTVMVVVVVVVVVVVMVACVATVSGIITQNSGSNNPQGQCDYSFLKRKCEIELEHHQQQQQQQQQQVVSATTTTTATATATATTTTTASPYDNQQIETNPWKKRLVEYDTGSGNDLVGYHLHLDAPVSRGGSSSSFINDLFAYDNSLLVPSASYPSASTIDDSTGESWQTGELLELDHRYNSGLQTSSTSSSSSLNASLPALPVAATPVTPPPIASQTTSTTSTTNPSSSQIQAQASSQNQSFLVPQKQMPSSRRRISLNSMATTTSSESEPDFEDKNLSWLLNFKFDEFPHLSPDVGRVHGHHHHHHPNANVTDITSNAGITGTQPNSTSPCSSNSPTSVSVSASSCGSMIEQQQHQRSRSPKNCSSLAQNTSLGLVGGVSNTNGGGCGGGGGGGGAAVVVTNKTGRKFEELVMEVTSELDGNDMIVAEHVVVEDTTSKAPKKPPFTYTELIEYALEDKGELTVSGIYQWISDRFPYYKSNDDRWKNSVRHNLSINPHFRKGVKAPQGAGHLWAISSGDSAENVLAWEHKKQRLDLFFKMESINRERMQQQQQQQQQQQLQHQQQQQICNSPQNTTQSTSSNCIYDEGNVAAAALTQEMLQQHGETSPTATAAAATHHQQQQQQQHQRLLPFNDLLSDEELRKTAGQILNGIHREVEVQSVNSIISTYQDVLLDNDYLNPIHKDVVVTESVLRQQQHNQQQHHSHHHQQQQQQHHHQQQQQHLGLNHHSQYYITEIDPMELGIQMSQHQMEPSEEEVLFSDEFNLNYFGYNPGSDIVA